jgi:hypothetical protein
MTQTGFMGTIRFKRPLTEQEITEWQARGVQPTNISGRIDHIGRVYGAHIEWQALDMLKASPLVEQVESETILPYVRPLKTTRPMTNMPAAAGQALLASETAGAGQTIVDIDSGIDPFHPSLFRPDGGVYRWIDVDGDGALSLGVDAIDLNQNGTADAGETLELLEATLFDWGENGEQPNGTFTPLEDWLYADANKNSRRDYGPDFGYDDSWPGFGEPTFLADDANSNGKLDLNERLFRLGSSKIVGALINGESYLRDDNLTSLTLGEPVNGQLEESHGHSVAGILVGGTAGFSRYLGMTPGADIIMVGSRNDPTTGDVPNQPRISPVVSSLAWARDLGADIALFEFSTWGTTAMDGTSNLAVAMDELHWNERISNVCPAGNLADSGKHTEGEALPAGTDVGFTFPDKWYDDYPFKSQMVALTFYWKGIDNALSIRLEIPGAPAVDVSYGTGFSLGAHYGQCASNKSPNNMVQVTCYLYTEQSTMPAGYYRAIVTSNLGVPVPFHAYLNDAISGWARGVTFVSETTTSTICNPATANTAITVGAYGGQFGPAEEIGGLRGYSSRGPRIDGEQGMDITGPDDPFAPLPTVPAGTFWPTSPEIQGGFQVFGGTSGAGPHVAGAVAMMRQLNPGWPPARVKQEIQAGAKTDAAMGDVPNVGWGFGKVDAYSSSMGSAWTGNVGPTAQATLASRVGPTATVSAAKSTDPDGDDTTLQARWDWNYDGEWDTEFGPLEVEHEFALDGDASVEVTIRVQVLDEAGFADVALLTFEIADDAPIETPADTSPSADAGSTSGAEADSSDNALPLPRSNDISDSSGCSAGLPGHNTAIRWLLVTLLFLAIYRPNRHQEV